MSFLDDDNGFDDIVNQFFGGNARRKPSRSRQYRSESEERTIDFIENDDNIYVIFELSGYDEDDISVKVDGKVLEVSAKKKITDEVKDYLAPKLSSGVVYQKSLPESVVAKDFDYSVKNGVLEIKFRRKK